jgi:N-methylhydantoinase A
VSNLKVGIDVGGTMTDLVAYDPTSGELIIAKTHSTPPTFTKGVMNVIRRSKINIREISYIIHGTTIIDNLFIERRFPKTCLITTEGFKDIIFIGRYWRGELFDIQWDKPAQFRPLIRRRDIFTVKERIASNGEIIVPLKEEEVYVLAKRIREKNYESVAVFFINSYVNPVHEQKVKSIIKREIPDSFISISSEISPIIRELPRLSTTLINALSMPVMSRYVKELAESLKESKFEGELLIMQSSGGIVRPEIAVEKPVYVATSGPAAGVTASHYLSELLGIPNIISFDMGGTTAKASTIKDYEPTLTTEFHLDWDIPIAVPMIDMSEVGAGGGSIAWIDEGGMLRVGPKSAGAVPGPVCYGMGGTEPTITDASVVLGILNPKNFLGGEMLLDVERAKDAIKKKIADPLGLGVEEVAKGILRLADTIMAQAIRAVTIERGYDPRDFVLFAFGGGGPMHACSLAKELGIRKIVIPRYPSLFSAFGLCMSDFVSEFIKTRLIDADIAEPREINEIFQELESEALNEMIRQRVPENRIKLYRFAKMKYAGEMIGWGVEVPVPSKRLTKEDVQELINKFHEIHEVRFGFSRLNEKVQLVDFRVRAVGLMEKIRLKRIEKTSELKPEKALKEKREVYFEDWILTPIYDIEKLEPGIFMDGPLIIEESTTTIVVPEGFRVEIDEYKNVIIEVI